MPESASDVAAATEDIVLGQRASCQWRPATSSICMFARAANPAWQQNLMPLFAVRNSIACMQAKSVLCAISDCAASHSLACSSGSIKYVVFFSCALTLIWQDHEAMQQNSRPRTLHGKPVCREILVLVLSEMTATFQCCSHHAFAPDEK